MIQSGEAETKSVHCSPTVSIFQKNIENFKKLFKTIYTLCLIFLIIKVIM